MWFTHSGIHAGAQKKKKKKTRGEIGNRCLEAVQGCDMRDEVDEVSKNQSLSDEEGHKAACGQIPLSPYNDTDVSTLTLLTRESHDALSNGGGGRKICRAGWL